MSKAFHNTASSEKAYGSIGLISKLPFYKKILQKAVCHQLIMFLNTNSDFDKFQSGFRYSTNWT